MEHLENIDFNGNFTAGHSIIHRLDPRTKLLSFVFMAIILMKNQSFTKDFLFIVMGFVLLLLSKVPPSKPIKLILGFYWLIFFSAFFHLFFPQGSNVFPLPSIEAFYNALLVALSLMINILFAYILTATTHPKELAMALEKFLRPFNGFLSVKKISFVFELSLCLVPDVFRESVKAVSDFKPRLDSSKSLMDKIKSAQESLAYFFINSFRLADGLARRVSSSCFLDVENNLSFKTADFCALIMILIIAVSANSL